MDPWTSPTLRGGKLALRHPNHCGDKYFFCTIKHPKHYRSGHRTSSLEEKKKDRDTRNIADEKK